MTDKNDYKIVLDQIQKTIHTELKKTGFKKKGRTHNNILENGIVQVVNFQMGKYEFDHVEEIPGLRTNLYGKFVINLGVFVPELYENLTDQKPKAIIQEHDCEIRTRLSDNGNWFSLQSDLHETSEQIIEQLNIVGQKWFDRFDNRTKIVSELTESDKTIFSPRDALCGAIIELSIDKPNGERIFNKYFESIEDGSMHQSYVVRLAEKLKVTLNKKPAHNNGYNSAWLDDILKK